MLVPVVGVSRVAMIVVGEIDMATVLHRFVPARFAMCMRMRLVNDVSLRGAFVLVAVVRSVSMAVVQIIGMVSVRDRRVAAVRPVLVGMIGM